MNIAFFTDSYKPNKDGVVVSIELMRKYLRRRKHRVIVFAPSPSGKDKIEGDVIYFKSRPFSPYPNYRLAFPKTRLIERIMKEESIDIIHNHGIALTAWAAVRTGRKLGIPLISTFHTDITQATHYITKGMADSIAKRIAWGYLHYLYSHFDAITAPSMKVVRELRRHGIKAFLLPNGIDLSKFKPGNKKKDFLLFVGRLVKEKELNVVFPCISKLKEKLVVAGDGPAKEYYIEKAKEANANVSFLGFVSDKRLRKLYREAKAFVFPSLFDTQGLVALEALASNTAVIARKGSAPAEMLPKECIFNSCRSFKRALRDCALKRNWRAIAKAYDINKVGRQLEELYITLRREHDNKGKG